jgi:DNA polymerase Ligase (LigD)
MEHMQTMPRFVLLLHECPRGVPRATHCDLMVEFAGTLRTWAVEQLPRTWGGLIDTTTEEAEYSLPVAGSERGVATRLDDHRLDYLDYEGPVSRDRGTVRRLDAGTVEVVVDLPATCEMRITSGRLRGHLKLTRQGESSDQWLVAFRPQAD